MPKTIRVAPGESIADVAARLEIPMEELRAANPGSEPLATGQVLKVPEQAPPPPSPTPAPPQGYVPYQYAAPQDQGILPSSQLAFDAVSAKVKNNQPLSTADIGIIAAHYGTAPEMVISNFSQNGWQSVGGVLVAPASASIPSPSASAPSASAAPSAAPLPSTSAYVPQWAQEAMALTPNQRASSPSYKTDENGNVRFVGSYTTIGGLPTTKDIGSTPKGTPQFADINPNAGKWKVAAHNWKAFAAPVYDSQGQIVAWQRITAFGSSRGLTQYRQGLLSGPPSGGTTVPRVSSQTMTNAYEATTAARNNPTPSSPGGSDYKSKRKSAKANAAGAPARGTNAPRTLTPR